MNYIGIIVPIAFCLILLSSVVLPPLFTFHSNTRCWKGFFKWWISDHKYWGCSFLFSEYKNAASQGIPFASFKDNFYYAHLANYKKGHPYMRDVSVRHLLKSLLSNQQFVEKHYGVDSYSPAFHDKIMVEWDKTRAQNSTISSVLKEEYIKDSEHIEMVLREHFGNNPNYKWAIALEACNRSKLFSVLFERENFYDFSKSILGEKMIQRESYDKSMDAYKSGLKGNKKTAQGMIISLCNKMIEYNSR